MMYTNNRTLASSGEGKNLGSTRSALRVLYPLLWVSIRSKGMAGYAADLNPLLTTSNLRM
jgi:hypothetical protein